MTGLTRRSALGLAFLAAGCGGGERLPPLQSGPPSYRHLTPLRLDVASLEIAPALSSARIAAAPPAPVNPAQAMLAMAEDRLSASGRDGVGRFLVQTALLTRGGAGGGGLFSSNTERLDCILRCRLELRSADGELRGFAEAEVRRTATQPAGDEAARARNADTIIREAMADMNVEFEFQVRRNLRAALMDTERAAPAAAPVEQETLARP
ncbi:hypothetical protein [Plastoroseomonas arctica]|uniref:Lipoprotein n=1 Tax=Plastoroseomonas arctica TaxID=1509237 RepID=A0AAF1KP91_9PROT|nr:hypothetical protein [Plastoroseomonas arctica]MBR0657179.1 hypothetical protein [Plastoroseomonas arctica]